MTEDREDLLGSGRNRAERLLANLLHLQTDLLASRATELSPEQRQAGEAALQKAITQVRKTIDAMDAAIKSVNA